MTEPDSGSVSFNQKEYAMTIRSLVVLIATFSTLSGCGFYLRQADSFPDALSRIQLSCDDSSAAVCTYLQRDLLSAGVQPTNTAEAFRVDISKVTQTQTAVSIDNKARAAEYEITRTINLILTHPSGTKILDTASSRSQHYRYSEENILAKEKESRDIERKLDEMLAMSVFQQLKSFDQAKINNALKDNP